jgi:hypothetical protein
MRAHAGPHAFRFVNFVEMTCPLFDAWSLSSFLHAYDGSLDGMGLDWWYMAFLESETRRNAAMVDGITILNPDNRQKNQDIREIDKFNSCGERERQWLYAQSRYPHDLQYSVAPREQHTFEYSHADRRRGFVFIWKIFTGVLKAALSPFRHFSRDECAAG